MFVRSVSTKFVNSSFAAYSAADRAASHAADHAADRAADHAAYSAADHAAYHAADHAADRAADRAVYSADDSAVDAAAAAASVLDRAAYHAADRAADCLDSSPVSRYSLTMSGAFHKWITFSACVRAKARKGSSALTRHKITRSLQINLSGPLSISVKHSTRQTVLPRA